MGNSMNAASVSGLTYRSTGGGGARYLYTYELSRGRRRRSPLLAKQTYSARGALDVFVTPNFGNVIRGLRLPANRGSVFAEDLVVRDMSAISK